MRRIARLLAVATLAVAAGPVLGVGVAHGGIVEPGHELTVAKVVEGTAPSGFVVHVECREADPNNGLFFEWDLPFLADGSPDPDAPTDVTDDWAIVDGAWHSFTPFVGEFECTAVETEDAGATSTTYQCEYVPADLPATLEDDQSSAQQLEDPGCEAAESTERAAVLFELPEVCQPPGDDGALQEPMICVDQAFFTVTNTFVEEEVVEPPAPAVGAEPAAPVPAAARFTG